MSDRSVACLVVLVAALAACAASPNINVGHESDGSVAGSGGGSGFAGSAGQGGFGGDNDRLTALITQPPSEMAIEVITVGCAGECKQALAVASGGNAPYTFAWNDGANGDSREICADDDTTFTVTVTDTALVDDEFNYEAQTVTASVEARVLQCPGDGGVPQGSLCLNNPSLEGTPTLGQIFIPGSAAPPGWRVCEFSPDINPVSTNTFPASEGSTYLGVAFGNGSGVPETASNQLCAPLLADTSVPFSVDLMMASQAMHGLPGVLQIWGGATNCGRDELLWTSPAVTNHGSWSTYCGTLRPSATHIFITVVPDPGAAVFDPGTLAYLAIDNFQSASTCD